MKKMRLFQGLLFLLLSVGCKSPGQDISPVDYVNPLIGTGSYGNTFPGACLPFGMVQLSPDNGAVGEKNYKYGKDTIMGFSHTHLSGTGTGTTTKYANISFMPTVGPVREPDSGRLKKSFGSFFLHQKEVARPGFYKVMLDDYQILAELTATQRTGIHRYTFPQTDKGNIIIDLNRMPNHGGEVINASVNIIGKNAVTGYTSSLDAETRKSFTTYFYAEFSKNFRSFGTFRNHQVTEGKRRAESTEDVGAYLTFAMKEDEKIVVKTGISFTSMEGAKKNLKSETPGWDFDAIRDKASEIWDKKLRMVKIKGGTQINKVKFYTGLYHSLLFPRTYSDVDSSYYSHFSDRVITSPTGNYYVDFSLWDTYRALHPLFTIIEPERQNEMVRTLLDMYKQGGRIPLRISYRNFYSIGMIGDHGSSVIIDSYMKGLRDFDVDLAYEGMIRNAFDPDPDKLKMREGLDTYKSLGYVAADRTRESVSLTLEHAFVDGILAQMAQSLGKKEDYAALLKRSGYYKNVFDPEMGLFRPRMADGTWLSLCRRGQVPQIVRNEYHSFYDCFDPYWIGVSPNRHLTESNAYQYLFHVPHDIPGMISLMGGRKAFSEKLEDLFNDSSSNSGPHYIGVSGAIGQYVHGNEPSHHVPYLFNYAGKPWKTQQRVREILETKYGIDHRGLPGNDDMGQMSAWFVFGALGFYPVTPGHPVYAIGSPLFEKAVIHLGDYYGNQTFTIKARNVSGDNKFIQSANLNGDPLEEPWITHEEITRGGTLELEMGPLPNKEWGILPEAREN